MKLRVRAPAQRVTAIGGPRPTRGSHGSGDVPFPATLARVSSFPLVETQKELTEGGAFWQVAAAFLSRSAGTPSGGATRRNAGS